MKISSYEVKSKISKLRKYLRQQVKLLQQIVDLEYLIQSSNDLEVKQRTELLKAELMTKYNKIKKGFNEESKIFEKPKNN